MALLAAGRIVRAIGLKGQVGVGGSSGSLGQVAQVHLAGSDHAEAPKILRLRSAVAQGKLWALSLEGVDDRNAAERLVGQQVWIERGDLPTEPNEPYWADLQGASVVDRNGKALGRVVGLIPTGAADVLEVERAVGQGPWLLPFAPYVRWQPEEKTLIVEAPDELLHGLLDVETLPAD